MSSTGANRETQGGTMKNVVDDQSTKPQSHKYAEEQSNSNADQGNKAKTNDTTGTSGTYSNSESPGGTMKNVIDDQSTKPQSHKVAENQSNANAGQGNNKCSSGGADHQQGQNSCDSCHKK
jgi:hypothetical protein